MIHACNVALGFDVTVKRGVRFTQYISPCTS